MCGGGRGQLDSSAVTKRPPSLQNPSPVHAALAPLVGGWVTPAKGCKSLARYWGLWLSENSRECKWRLWGPPAVL